MNPRHLAGLLTTGAALLLSACGPGKEVTATDSAVAAPAPPAAATGAELAAGQAVFQRVCAACHQLNGLGVPGVFPPLAGSPLLAEADPGRLIRIVLHGLQGPIEVHGQTYNSVMPPQGPLLQDREIAHALTYVRATWGNNAPPVTLEAVTQVRSTVKRDTMWTWAELKK